MQMGVGGVKFTEKSYEGVRFNVISITRGWVGVKFPEKNRYVTAGALASIPLTQVTGSLRHSLQNVS